MKFIVSCAVTFAIAIFFFTLPQKSDQGAQIICDSTVRDMPTTTELIGLGSMERFVVATACSVHFGRADMMTQIKLALVAWHRDLVLWAESKLGLDLRPKRKVAWL